MNKALMLADEMLGAKIVYKDEEGDTEDRVSSLLKLFPQLL